MVVTFKGKKEERTEKKDRRIKQRKQKVEQNKDTFCSVTCHELTYAVQE
jgi:hypothetical protein